MMQRFFGVSNLGKSHSCCWLCVVGDCICLGMYVGCTECATCELQLFTGLIQFAPDSAATTGIYRRSHSRNAAFTFLIFITTVYNK